MLQQRANKRAGHGFALPEALIVFAVLAVVLAMIGLSAHDSRRRSRLGCSIDNLRFLGSGTYTYAADHADRFWTFSWRAGVQDTEFADLNSAGDDLAAAANQGVYIIRKYGEAPQMPRINGWLPHVRFSHLALWEHLGLQLPTRAHVSPEDRSLLLLQRDAGGATQSTRLAYGTSYEFGTAFLGPDAATIVNGVIVPTFTQGPTHSTWQVGTTTPLGHRTTSEVRFPAHKALVWDSHQRDLGGRVLFHSMPDARVPVLTVDGSAGIRSAAATNRGFNPSTPLSPAPTMFQYQPGPTEPPAQDASGGDLVVGRQRWTRWGLRGRDFNGPEATGP